MSDWHKERNWIDEHRFYLNSAQCAQVNEGLKMLEAKVRSEAGAIWMVVALFKPDPEMNDSFFETEA
jgi:hypothetical protein